MANQEHLEVLKQGVEVWNRWRKEHPHTLPDLTKITMGDVNLSGANFRGARLGQAQLHPVVLRWADLRDADLSQSTLAGSDLLGADFENANLSRSNLSETNCRRASFAGANLSGADLMLSNLTNADLPYARLSKAMLIGANFLQTNLRDTNLEGADFRTAYLFGANFSRANLGEADLDQATIGLTVFGDIDLRQVQHLDTVNHESPSIIGIDTIYRSQGDIPDIFLRGAGVPDTMLEYAHALTGKSIDYYSCFISYASQDQSFAERLHADLQEKGVRCWFARHDLKIGDHYPQRIDESIRLYDKLILILSEHAVRRTSTLMRGDTYCKYPLR